MFCWYRAHDPSRKLIYMFYVIDTDNVDQLLKINNK